MLPAFTAAYSLLSIWILYRVSKIVYNLCLHPLAHIPGPKLAAITYLYQTYFSLVGGSHFYIQIGKLHELYGPVVRITPDEVHLSDPDNYDKIYYVGSKYSKWAPYYDTMSCGTSGFGTVGNGEHRVKRHALNPFFSRKKIIELEDVVQFNAKKLCDLVARKFDNNQSINLHHGFRSASVDIITDYAMNQNYNLLDRDDIGEGYFVMWENLGPSMWIFQQWPILMHLANSMPKSWASAMSGPLAHVSRIQAHCRDAIAFVKSDMAAGGKSAARKTIFHDLLTPDPDHGYVVPPVQQLEDEAVAILGAAGDTTGGAMSYATYEVLSDPAKYKRLITELRTAFPDPNGELDFLALEKLPYLTGVIREGIRLSFGSPGKLSRVVPQPGASFNGYTIPSGSVVSMSTWEMHHNEDYWPNAAKFDPDRWTDPSKAQRLEKAYVPFGKGSRMCIGINLAYCELYVVLGTLFRRFDNMKANHLRPEDRVVNDYISGKLSRGATTLEISAGRKIV